MLSSSSLYTALRPRYTLPSSSLYTVLYTVLRPRYTLSSSSLYTVFILVIHCSPRMVVWSKTDWTAPCMGYAEWSGKRRAVGRKHVRSASETDTRRPGPRSRHTLIAYVIPRTGHQRQISPHCYLQQLDCFPFSSWSGVTRFALVLLATALGL